MSNTWQTKSIFFPVLKHGAHVLRFGSRRKKKSYLQLLWWARRCWCWPAAASSSPRPPHPPCWENFNSKHSKVQSHFVSNFRPKAESLPANFYLNFNTFFKNVGSWKWVSKVDCCKWITIWSELYTVSGKVFLFVASVHSPKTNSLYITPSSDKDQKWKAARNNWMRIKNFLSMCLTSEIHLTFYIFNNHLVYWSKVIIFHVLITFFSSLRQPLTSIPNQVYFYWELGNWDGLPVMTLICGYFLGPIKSIESILG